MKRNTPVFLALAFCLRLSSCAGDGEIYPDASFAAASASLAGGLVMSWAAPVAYSDSTDLDPLEELDVYEIYVNQTGIFFPDDEPAAYVSAVDSKGDATEAFDLANLQHPFTVGQTYHVSMRAVSMSGRRSDYSRVFSFTIHSGFDTEPDIDRFLCTPSNFLRVRLPEA